MFSPLNIQTFSGSWAELAEFVHRVWSQNYQGKMTFPGWTPEYLEWQLGAASNRDNLLAAYQGDTLAGVLLGMQSPVRNREQVISATQWSWLSVDAEFRGRGIAKLLDDERVRRGREQGDELIISYRYVGSKHSRAERPNTQNANKQFHSKVGFWARIIDPDRFSDWHYSRLEGSLARWFRGLSPRIQDVASPRIGMPEVSDLPQCVERMWIANMGYELAGHWDADRLYRQLWGWNKSYSLVLRNGGRIEGLLNYHLLPFHGRTTEQVAVIDLVSTSSTDDTTILIQAALGQMKSQGTVLALKLRTGDTPTWSMLRTGFLPQPADSFLVFQWINRPQELSRHGRLQLLWR